MTSKTIAALLAVFAAFATACSAPTPPRQQPVKAASTCAPPQRGANLGAEKPTTIDVVEQAYTCILGNYYSGATLDARSLLAAGFVALTQELNRNGRDVPEATMPALTGDRKADWAAFEATFLRITGSVPELREKLAVVTLEAIVAGLDDNHARWMHGGNQRPPESYDGDQYGLGLRANVYGPQVTQNHAVAVPPLFVMAVSGGPARAAGLRPGDIIESINGSAPFVSGKLTPAVAAALNPRYPDAAPVRLRVKREGRSWSVTLKPGVFQPDPAALQVVTPKLLAGDVAYVRLAGFAPDSAARVLRAISTLATGRTLTGVVLDLRGNTGGSAAEPSKLLGAFAHGKVDAYHCTADGVCDPSVTDDSVALLNLPLAVLTDRSCASACEHFSSAVKDHRLGVLVGTRTAGVISGPAQPYLLDNNTMLSFPAMHHLGPNKELIDKIGVAPDHYVPMLAKDVAAGRDPALAKALSLLDK